METGAEAVRVIEAERAAVAGTAGNAAIGPRHLLFLDADLAETAGEAGPLAEPVLAGHADMTIATFSTRVKRGGHGLVMGLSGAGIERATGWRPTEPLNGQRCLTRAAFEAARPLAPGWGAETGLTIDLLRKGMRVAEVQVPLAHRANRHGPPLASPQGQAATRRRPGARATSAVAARDRMARRTGGRSTGRGSAMSDVNRCAYLGPRGTFCEQAVSALHPDSELEPVACASIEATLDAVHSGHANRAVVPIESSVEGGVNATLDELAAGPQLLIKAEVIVPVEFALLARPGTELEDIKVVGGHPVAQPQCRQWLAKNLPEAHWRPTLSNADAAQQVADSEIDAALAGSFAARHYRLAVLADGVHDNAAAVTRFVEVGLPGPLPDRTGNDRTSVIAFLADDHPGALMDILSQFAVRGVGPEQDRVAPNWRGDRPVLLLH